MFANATAAGSDRTPGYKERMRPVRHPVRVALVTWPVVVCLGATVAAAACLIGDCDERAEVKARATRSGIPAPCGRSRSAPTVRFFPRSESTGRS